MLTAKGLGATHYRMSIAWTRIFPNGDGAINQPGLDHYAEQIDFAIAIGLEPVLTCYHWDLPQVEAIDHPLKQCDKIDPKTNKLKYLETPKLPC